MNNKNINTIFRKIPSMNIILEELESFTEKIDDEYLHKKLLDDSIAEIKKNILEKEDDFERDDFINIIKDVYLVKKNDLISPNLKNVINATGTIIHTNLGRSPISQDTLEHVKNTNCSYNNLELNVSTGKRGSRYEHINKYIYDLTGFEDSIIVNNNAAAVYLIVDTFAKNKESIISRGELVEIGGSFRIPEIMARSNTKVIEIGTTNKTHLIDYKNALSEDTGMICKVHQSNFYIEGFTAEASIEDIIKLKKEEQSNAVVYYDIGAGSLYDYANFKIDSEKPINYYSKIDLDIISFSADKLIGSAQGGIIAGKKELIATLKKNQMLRAFRIDKLSLSAIEYDLQKYLYKDKITKTNLLLSIINKNIDDILSDGETILNKIEDNRNLELIKSKSIIGGGSLPKSNIPTFCLKFPLKDNTKDKLINRKIPIIIRSENSYGYIDIRTLLENDDKEIIKFFNEEY